MPKNWQSYSSSDWTVSAYIVPIFSFDVEFNGKTYVFSANLHNGHYHFHYPKNLKLEKKAKKARSLGKGLIVLGLFVSLITLVASISVKRTPGIIMSLVMGAANIITLKNHNTSLTSVKRKIAKHKKQSMSAAILPEIIMAVLSWVVFGISMM